MEKFKLTGLWREFHDNPSFPSIFDSIKNTSILEDKKQILSYLKTGRYVLGRRNMRDCPITSEPMYPQAIYTDGGWIWGSELVYYITFNNIAINPDFLLHIRENNFVFPEVEKSEIEAMALEVAELINYNKHPIYYIRG